VSDWEAEFESKMRRNEKWHARWDAYSEEDEMSHAYTDHETGLEIDPERLDSRHNDEGAALERLSLGDDWLSNASSGGESRSRGSSSDFGGGDTDAQAAAAMAMATTTATTLPATADFVAAAQLPPPPPLPRRPPLPPEIALWRRCGGEVILRISPCPAAALAHMIRERLVLHRERKTLRVSYKTRTLCLSFFLYVYTAFLSCFKLVGDKK
jgi:hypothetical protein